MNGVRWLPPCILLLAGLVLAVWLMTGHPRSEGDSKVPLDRSAFLREVLEPITMVRGVSWDDNSQGLVFRDSRQSEKSVCLLFLEEEDDPRKRNLLFGSEVPDPQYGERVPVGGSEELAFLGLLERWSRGDPEAQSIDRRIVEKRSEPFADVGKPDEYYGKVIAVRMLRILRQRN